MPATRGSLMKLPAFTLDAGNTDWPPPLVAGSTAGLLASAASEPILPVFCTAGGWMRLAGVTRPSENVSLDDEQGAYSYDVWTSSRHPWATAGFPVAAAGCIFGSHQICFGYDGSQLTMADEFDAAYDTVIDPGGWDAISCFNFWPNRMEPYPWVTGEEPFFRQVGTGVLNRVWWGTGTPFVELGPDGEPVFELTGLAFGRIAVIHPQFGFDSFPGYYTETASDNYDHNVVIDSVSPTVSHGEWSLVSPASLPSPAPGYALVGTGTWTETLEDIFAPPGHIYTPAPDQPQTHLVGLYRHTAFVAATKTAFEAYKAAAPGFRALVVYGDPSVTSIEEPANGQHDPATLALIEQVRTPEECVADITGDVFEIERVPFEGVGDWATRASAVIQAWLAALDD